MKTLKTFTLAAEAKGNYLYKTQAAARKAFRENDGMRRDEGGSKYSRWDAEDAFKDMLQPWIKDEWVPKTATKWTLY